MSVEPEFIGDPDWPTLEWIEREYTVARLKHFNGNKAATARSLGVCLKTLYNRLHRYEQMDKQVAQERASAPSGRREMRA